MDRRRWWLLVGGGTLAIIGLGTGAVSLMRASAEREFQAELALARQEGMPTTPAEFTALIPWAEPAENAAKFYRQVKVSLPPQAVELADRLIHAPTPADVAEAELLVTTEAASLRLIEEGTRLAQCNFERDWEGMIELEMPEYRQLRDAAALLRMRGTLRMRAGQHAQAISDLELTLSLARHLELEPTSEAQRAAMVLWAQAVRTLAGWVDRSKGQYDYSAKLASTIDQWPDPDVRRVAASLLVIDLQAAALLQSPSGRRKLGLKREDYTWEHAIYSKLGPPNARVLLVTGHRGLWKSLHLPSGRRQADMAPSLNTIDRAYGAYQPLGEPIEPPRFFWLGTYEAEVAARKLQFKALARAIKLRRPGLPLTVMQPDPTKLVDTSDLIGPIDGKPVRLSIEGGKLIIQCGRSSLSYPPIGAGYAPPSAPPATIISEPPPGDWYKQ